MSFKEVFDPRRVRKLKESKYEQGRVVYWMTRDQRVDDNWALLYAREAAKSQGEGLAVVFNLVPEFLEATWRQYHFMLEGLRQVASKLESKNIAFYILQGDPTQTVPEFVKQYDVGLLVTDFSPLNVATGWREQVARSLPKSTAMHILDAHNVIPVWVTSDKQEYAARTIRPKINEKLDEWLISIPDQYEATEEWKAEVPKIDWDQLSSKLKINREVEPVDWLTPGEQAAKLAMHRFIEERLPGYNENRNYPEKQHLSHLSPYLHFGQLSAQRLAYEVREADAPQQDIDAYLEELVVRRELSDNYCYYNSNYDNFSGFPDWAKKTLKDHWDDQREHIYTLEELENGATHDDLWNASQIEMVRTGKMHGYMRMYWCKKILEWTESPEQAQDFAIYLNDKYELDGRDPNGYVGIAWSIGGVHDRAWTERPIFGKIRFMSRNSTGKKFDSGKYIRMNPSADAF